jgi:abortive infection bacteriophage resistance protein
MPKPPTTVEEQLGILESRGLIVADRPGALHHLGHANYFRLACYHHPFLRPGSDAFVPGTRFEDLWEIYRFDHHLRMLVLDVIERCEISFRTRWAYELAHRHGPRAYENPAIHRDTAKHGDTLAKVDAEIRRSTEEFLRPHRSAGAPRPPIWMVCEVMSLGQLSALYDNLSAPSDRQAIADTYALDEIVLRSFLHHLTVVRNICAHHARLWNRHFAFTFTPPRKKPPGLLPQFTSAQPRCIYNTLVMLAWLLDGIEPGHHWTKRLLQLIDSQRFPVAQHLGCPPGWRERPIWKQASQP